MYAFPKSARLRHSLEFRQTLDRGVKTVSSQVVLFACPSDKTRATNGARMGLIVSRKVGEAVVRTRVKRHLREAFRHLKPEIDQVPWLKDMDLVVLARPSAATATSAELAEALLHGLKRMSRQLPKPTATSPQGPHDGSC